jgi:hypothetical protein
VPEFLVRDQPQVYGCRTVLREYPDQSARHGCPAV